MIDMTRRLSAWLIRLSLICLFLTHPAIAADKAPGLRIATFQTDATPPIGYEMGYSVVKTIGTPLQAKGVVILGAGKPIVMLAVDWGGVDGRARDEWHALLAEAAGTNCASSSVRPGKREHPKRTSLIATHQQCRSSLNNEGNREDHTPFGDLALLDDNLGVFDPGPFNSGNSLRCLGDPLRHRVFDPLRGTGDNLDNLCYSHAISP